MSFYACSFYFTINTGEFLMFNFFLNRFIEKPVMTASGQTESR